MKTYYGIMPVQAGRIATVKLAHVGFTLKQTFLLTLTGGEVFRYSGKRPTPGEWLIKTLKGELDVISDDEFQRKLFAEDPSTRADVNAELLNDLTDAKKQREQAREELLKVTTNRDALSKQLAQAIQQNSEWYPVIEYLSEGHAHSQGTGPQEVLRLLKAGMDLSRAHDALAKELDINKKMLKDVGEETRMAWNERDQAREELENCRHDLKQANDRLNVEITANRFLRNKVSELIQKLSVFVRMEKVVLDNGSEIKLASSGPIVKEPDALDRLDAELSAAELTGKQLAKNPLFQEAPVEFEASLMEVRPAHLPPRGYEPDGSKGPPHAWTSDQFEEARKWDAEHPLIDHKPRTAGATEMSAMMAKAREMAIDALDKAGRYGRIVFTPRPINEETIEEARAQLEMSKARLRAMSGPRQPMIGDTVCVLQGGSVFVALITRTFASGNGSAELLIAFTNGFSGTIGWQSGLTVPRFTTTPEIAPGPRWCYPHELEDATAMLNDASKKEAK